MSEVQKIDLSEYCKAKCGFQAKEVAELAEVPRRTFYSFWKSKRRVVELIVLGIKAERVNKSESEDQKVDLSEYCKAKCGFDAKEVTVLAEVPRKTFYSWWKSRRRAVELIVLGIKTERANKE